MLPDVRRYALYKAFDSRHINMVANLIDIQPNYFVPTSKCRTEFNLMQLVSQYVYVDPNLLHTVLLYCSSEMVTLALYYLHFTIRSTNHFLVCLILACKYLDDYAMTLKAWAEITNVPVNILRYLEMTILKDLKYCLHVQADFDYFCQQISAFYLH